MMKKYVQKFKAKVIFHTFFEQFKSNKDVYVGTNVISFVSLFQIQDVCYGSQPGVNNCITESDYGRLADHMIRIDESAVSFLT